MADCPSCRRERENAAYWRRKWLLMTAPQVPEDPGSSIQIADTTGFMVHTEPDLLELLFYLPGGEKPHFRVVMPRPVAESFIRLLPHVEAAGV